MAEDATIVKLPDFSAYLTPERLAHEEIEWAKTRFYERNAAALIEMEPRILLEVGCGTGWIPWEIRRRGYNCSYFGVDGNAGCLNLAHIKNPGLPFIFADLRAMLPGKGGFDTICAFAVLKHFGLHEWHEIFARFLSAAPRALFTMGISDRTHDDGEEYHHTWLTAEDLAAAVRQCDHRITRREVSCEGDKGNEELIWTTRTSATIYVPGAPLPS